MKYFSTDLKKVFDTVEELEAAEAEAAKAKDERAAAADEIQKANDKISETYKAYKDACKVYDDLLIDFCDKYGSYKTTVRSADIKRLDPLSQLLNFRFFNF